MIETVKKERRKLIATAGNLISYTVNEHGLQIETDDYHYDLVFYRPDIIRVHQYKGFQDTNPYTVIQNPEMARFSVDENEESLLIEGEAIDVAISKMPVLFTFLTKEGNVMNQDEPGLGTQRQGEQVTVYKKLQEGERFIGLGEKTGPLDRRGSGYENWNSDQFAYSPDTDPLYASIPFYIGVHGGLSYGIYLDNSHKSFMNFGASNNRFSSFSVDSGDMDYYLFSGSVEKIIESYTWLTGRMTMPPLWSIGYQQCRYSYYPDTEVLEVASKFREKDIPADVIVLDIHYMEKYKIFTWDKERFPYPKEMVDRLREMGFEVVVIFDPGIKIEENYHAYQEGIEKDVFLKYPDGRNYEGEVWPGWCSFPDFTNEKTREWWKEMMKSYAEIGVKGYWNDMNEIATWGKMMPENVEFEFEGEGATTRKGRNVYGLQMAKSTYEGAKANLNGQRPFNLTRAAFAGIQRYGALWTGDNVANDEHMMLGVRLVNSLGLSGVAFAGYDVGGFAGNGQSNLFARWVQVGAFSPFFRGHSMINSHDSEPWSYGEEVEEISKNYINLRYKLMPYIYSAFVEATETGLPVARSLSIGYTHDHNVYNGNFENQYLLGDSILVAPINSYETFNKIYLPKGTWYEFFTDEKLAGNQEMIREYELEHLPLFIKESSIIPVYPDAKDNSKKIGETLELHLYHGMEANSFEYYEDDGVSEAYETEVFHRRTIHFDPTTNMLMIGRSNGSYTSKIKHLKLIFHGFEVGSIDLSNFSGEWKEGPYAYVLPISNFDPFDNESRDKLKIQHVYSLDTSYGSDEMVFNW